jgi:hypothetical protein
MVNLRSAVQSVLQTYAGDAANGKVYLTISPEGDTFAVVGIGEINGQHFTSIPSVVRVLDEQVIIDGDRTDQSILENLVYAGVPRDKIIPAYAPTQNLEIA